MLKVPASIYILSDTCAFTSSMQSFFINNTFFVYAVSTILGDKLKIMNIIFLHACNLFSLKPVILFYLPRVC